MIGASCRLVSVEDKRKSCFAPVLNFDGIATTDLGNDFVIVGTDRVTNACSDQIDFIDSFVRTDDQNRFTGGLFHFLSAVVTE